MTRNAARNAIESVVAACCLLTAAWPAVAAQEREGTAAVSRVRSGNPKAAQLLRDGAARSATLRTIVETINHSDLMVYVETRPIKLPGQLQLLTATPGCRHIRITVRVPGNDTELVAWLSHELWHAVELAGAPDVRDQKSLLAFYQRIGVGGASETSAESGEAQETWIKVLHELRQAR